MVIKINTLSFSLYLPCDKVLCISLQLCTGLELSSAIGPTQNTI